MRRQWFWGLLVVLMGICGLCGATGWWLLQPAATPVLPKVEFRQPAPTAILPAGRPVQVEGWAYSTAQGIAIQRLLLWADGRLVGDQAGPNNPLGATWSWTPSTPGAHTLVLQAVDTQGRTAATYRSVTVQPAAEDPDGDSIPQGRDACPDRPGTWAWNGCPEPPPDPDGDAIPSNLDQCPDQAGTPTHSGCAQPQPGDADGDGILDAEDTCPQEPGPVNTHGCPNPPDTDGDSVPDWSDPCPQEFGLNGGCPTAPDSDGDGVPNDQDLCVDQPGSGEAGGCPVADSDGDGIPNDQDTCPDQAGSEAQNGCPVPQANDADGDAVPDASDLCPNNPGPVDHQGCPVVDSDGDGIPNDQDACPNEAGPAGNNGCPQPDGDGDGLPDDVDNCPNQPGPEVNHGCPLTDNDGDGIPNDADPCPEVAGDSASGCPPWAAFPWKNVGDTLRPRICDMAPWVCNLNLDTDDDGVPDGMDACPDDAGPAFNHGCPWQMPPLPGSGQEKPLFCAENPWICRFLPAPGGSGTPPDKVTLTFASPSITTDAGWLYIHCNANVAQSWYTLGPENWVTVPPNTQWDIQESLRNVTFDPPPTDGLSLTLLCWGWRDLTEGEVYLGIAAFSHTWDQPLPRTVDIQSANGEGGHFFTVHLAVCEGEGPCP